MITYRKIRVFKSGSHMAYVVHTQKKRFLKNRIRQLFHASFGRIRRTLGQNLRDCAKHSDCIFQWHFWRPNLRSLHLSPTKLNNLIISYILRRFFILVCVPILTHALVRGWCLTCKKYSLLGQTLIFPTLSKSIRCGKLSYKIITASCLTKILVVCTMATNK